MEKVVCPYCGYNHKITKCEKVQHDIKNGIAEAKKYKHLFPILKQTVCPYCNQTHKITECKQYKIDFDVFIRDKQIYRKNFVQRCKKLNIGIGSLFACAEPKSFVDPAGVEMPGIGLFLDLSYGNLESASNADWTQYDLLYREVFLIKIFSHKEILYIPDDFFTKDDFFFKSSNGSIFQLVKSKGKQNLPDSYTDVNSPWRKVKIENIYTSWLVSTFKNYDHSIRSKANGLSS